MSLVTDRKDLDTTIGEDGQQQNYLVLSEEERAKGFVRPVCCAYIHQGRAICGKLRGLGALDVGMVAWVCVDVAKHGGDCSAWRQATAPELKRLQDTGFLGGCGSVTTMGKALAETYAREPSFYTGTFCTKCKAHFPVGKDGEFAWVAEGPRELSIDGTKVGT